MSTTTHKPKILMTGLDTNANIPPYFRSLRHPSRNQSQHQRRRARCKDAGYDVTIYFMYDQNPQKGLDWLEAKLKETHFDGIMVGVGLRLIPEQTVFYEHVVNVARKTSPGSVLLFNEGPGKNYDAMQRNKESLE
ncbi:hypothetical protein EK21DRAFT_107170 [Setomelanomma holmii]|uniref:Uncharacterized protein n=1 Tax=Setomelanomma holmii TaxID=210430 RepID=A0A9P4LSL4_9PLEO|nr:hypothetical protein EK21DRAFT_107170 [Setomelanomma holmii]